MENIHCSVYVDTGNGNFLSHCTGKLSEPSLDYIVLFCVSWGVEDCKKLEVFFLFTATNGTRAICLCLISFLHAKGSYFSFYCLITTGQVCHLCHNGSYANARAKFPIENIKQVEHVSCIRALPGESQFSWDTERDESQISTRP